MKKCLAVFYLYNILTLSTHINGVQAEDNVLLNITAQDLENILDLAENKYECKKNQISVWCIPREYDRNIEPWRGSNVNDTHFPWLYQFQFNILDVQKVDDNEQTLSISTKFQITWLEPRLRINSSAIEWKDTKLGSLDEINVSPGVLDALWIPDVEIYGMETIEEKRVLKTMSSIQINKTRFVQYEALLDFTISCQMTFDRYPLETHACPFRIGSYESTNETVSCTSKHVYDLERQRSLQYSIEYEELPEADRTYSNNAIFDTKIFAVCGFNILLARNRVQILFQVYFVCILFVIVSWVSFIIQPQIVPGRMALLVTIFLVLINVFNEFKAHAPASKNLNAMDVYIIVCIGHVFLALIEYAVVLVHENYKTALPPTTTSIKRFSRSQNDTIKTKHAWQKTFGPWNKLDSISMFMFPIIFSIFNMTYWVIYI